MVKINTICRSEVDYARETKYDIQRVQRSTNPQLHQFQKAREFQRALVATKLNKIFAKPFVGTLLGHSDSISALAKCPNNLTKLLSGSFDGEIRAWDVSERKTLFQLNAHALHVKGLTFSPDGHRFLSTGDDKSVHLYDFYRLLEQQGRGTTSAVQQSIEPMQRFESEVALTNVDHCAGGGSNSNTFATAGQCVQLWSYERTQPLAKFEWGPDTVIKVRFNPSEHNLLASTGIDRGITLYDVRAQTTLHKATLQNKCNALCWNPAEPINFVVGCDDGNCYSFDMRNLSTARMIHKDHIGAIMDVDFAPTGREFVSGSYDKTVRIFAQDQGRAREVYHGRRMQKVFAVAWSLDNQYLFSGSEDMNIRLWKARAAQPLAVVDKRHEHALNYREALANKFEQVPEIRRIAHYRHLPKYILNANAKKHAQRESKHRKLKNMELNNPGDWTKPKPERQQKILEVQE